MKDISAKVKIGADPEAFFKKDNRVVGSERIIPPEGLTYDYGKIVRDGIQLEIHPNPQPGGAMFLFGISYALQKLATTLQKHPGVTLSFDQIVDVEKKELLALSQESRILGCQPSLNVYGLKSIEVDPMKYRKRSAGGHIHMGLPEYLFEFRIRLVNLMDVLVGIPCVLLDRDRAQSERRKLYGRAGEYRTPDHGLEYRTLSNFWLHSPVLAEFVLHQTFHACNVLFSTVTGEQNLEKELLSKVSFRTMIRAIQTNNAALAWDVWKEAVRPFLTLYPSKVLSTGNIPRFEKLVDLIAKDGLKCIGGADPLKNWVGGDYYYGSKWTTFLTTLKLEGGL